MVEDQKPAGAEANAAAQSAAGVETGPQPPVTDREEEDPYRPGTPLEMQAPNHSRRIDRGDVAEFGVDRGDTFEPATARTDNLQPADTSTNIKHDVSQRDLLGGGKPGASGDPSGANPEGAGHVSVDGKVIHTGAGNVDSRTDGPAAPRTE